METEAGASSKLLLLVAVTAATVAVCAVLAEAEASDREEKAPTNMCRMPVAARREDFDLNAFAGMLSDRHALVNPPAAQKAVP
jgi:hypothetical protein